MPYFALGYPDPEQSKSIIHAIAPYSDLLELGMPFSDPIADGPTIQRSTQRVLEKGIGTAECLEMLSSFRAEGLHTPALLMGYYNPILAYGEREFVNDAKVAGADGLIVPDLPAEESGDLARLCEVNGLALVLFVAPTSSQDRIRLVTSAASGFIYVVSVTGVTGARSSLPPVLPSFVQSVRKRAQLPVVVGFGISSPAQASEVAGYADGVIVGSALISAVDNGKDKVNAAREFVLDLSKALHSS